MYQRENDILYSLLFICLFFVFCLFVFLFSFVSFRLLLFVVDGCFFFSSYLIIVSFVCFFCLFFSCFFDYIINVRALDFCIASSNELCIKYVAGSGAIRSEGNSL